MDRILLCLALATLALGTDVEDLGSMQLLQQRLVLKTGPQEARLAAAEKIYWMHFPKCGSSFINALVRLPGVCPKASNLTVDEAWGGPCWLMAWSFATCPVMCNRDKMHCGDLHITPKHFQTEQQGHLMGFFRDPDQRILSGYHDKEHNFAAINYSSPVRCHEVHSMKGRPRVSLQEFAERWKGGMTFQLATKTHMTTYGVLSPSRPKVTAEDGTLAAYRVRAGFAFVGITEEWDLSICLFHKMFGGACSSPEFEDTRPSATFKSARQPYNTSMLMGWHDDIDAVVYAAALDVFRTNLALYDVSHETCQECFRNRSV